MFDPLRTFLDSIWTPIDYWGNFAGKDLLELAYLDRYSRLTRVRNRAYSLTVAELEQLFEQDSYLRNDPELQRIYILKKQAKEEE